MEQETPVGRTKPSFNSSLDDLKQVLFDAEDAFDSLLEKVEATVELQSGRAELISQDGALAGWIDTSDSLSFEKVGKVWRLLHVEWDSSMSDERELSKKPIVDASLHLRMLAVEKLPELLDAIRQARQHRIERVQEVVSKGQTFLERLYAEEATRG